MAEAIQDPIQDPIQRPIAAVDRQDGRFSFGEIHEYVVRGVYLEGFIPRKTSRLSGRGPSSFHSTLMYYYSFLTFLYIIIIYKIIIDFHLF